MSVHTFVIEERRGDLPYMVFWQSATGAPEFQEFETYEAALDKRRYLRDLGLAPVLYVVVADPENRIDSRSGLHHTSVGDGFQVRIPDPARNS